MGLLRSPAKAVKNALSDMVAPRRSAASSTRNYSFGSTMTVSGDFVKDSLSTVSSDSTVRTPTSALTVRFDEDANEFYESPSYCNGDDAQDVDLWYSGADAAAFRKECSQLARLLQAAESAGTECGSTWSQNLLDAYQGFLEADTADAVMQVFEQHATLLPDNATGLDSWVVRPIHCQRVERRRKLMNQVKKIACTVDSADARVKKCFKASRAASRPSRLYAHHLGLLVASAVQEDLERSEEQL